MLCGLVDSVSQKGEMMDARHARAREIALAKIDAALANPPTAEQVMHAREVIANSKRHGGDRRQNSRDRRRQTVRLLEEFGDGVTAPCYMCGTMLDAATLTRDKIFPGHMGGGYNHKNLLPACITCNRKRSDQAIDEFIVEARAAIAHAESLRDS